MVALGLAVVSMRCLSWPHDGVSAKSAAERAFTGNGPVVSAVGLVQHVLAPHPQPGDPGNSRLGQDAWLPPEDRVGVCPGLVQVG